VHCSYTMWATLLLLLSLLAPVSSFSLNLKNPTTYFRAKSPTYSRSYEYWKPSSAEGVEQRGYHGIDSNSSGVTTTTTTMSQASPELTTVVGPPPLQNLTFSQVYNMHHVQPPSQVPSFVWRWCYFIHKACLPILHKFDSAKPPDSALSLMVLWWKAMVGLDRSSQAYDGGLAYDMLPTGTRWLVKCLNLASRITRLRLHHANIELRTVFLDESVKKIVGRIKQQQPSRRVRVVVFGAGYDLRSMRLLRQGIVEEMIEMDLPDVVQAKQALLESPRFQQRQPNCTMPSRMLAVNLNDMEQTRVILSSLLTSPLPLSSSGSMEEPFTIFMFEGVMVHLANGSPHKLLQLLRSFETTTTRTAATSTTTTPTLTSTPESAYLPSCCIIFSDMLNNVKYRSCAMGQAEMESTGWRLTEWTANPTKTPHMGVAWPL
jgi:O-methyltransferase involved in polyketide biosynthesis